MQEVIVERVTGQICNSTISRSCISCNRPSGVYEAVQARWESSLTGPHTQRAHSPVLMEGEGGHGGSCRKGREGKEGAVLIRTRGRQGVISSSPKLTKRLSLLSKNLFGPTER